MIYVKKELAIELKEVGYDVPTETHYLKQDEMGEKLRSAISSFDWNNRASDAYSAPTLYEVTDWLRNKHNLHCYSIPFVQDKFATWDRSVIDLLTGECLYNNGFHETHDEALTAAIERAVEIVKTKMEKI